MIPVRLPVDDQPPDVACLREERPSHVHPGREERACLQAVRIEPAGLRIREVGAVQQRDPEPRRVVCPNVADDLVRNREREAAETGELERPKLEAQLGITRFNVRRRIERPLDRAVPPPRQVEVDRQRPLGAARQLVVPVQHPESLPGVLPLEQGRIGKVPTGIEALLGAVGNASEADARA